MSQEMTSKQRILTALRKGIPDRVPVVARMWKFLRKHYPDISKDPLELRLRAHQEFGNDIWVYAPGPPMPCFSPLGKAWRDDIEVEIKLEIRNGRNWWERTIHTPKGDLHDIKQALIVKKGSGSGPEIIEPLIKDPKIDLPKMPYMMADPKRIDLEKIKFYEKKVGDKGVVVADMYGPIDCRDMLKPEDFMTLYYDDRGAFREIVRIGAEAMMAETKYVLDAGMRLIFTWWFYTSPSYGWSPEIYKNEFLPWLIKHVELVHSYQDALYIYYDDGKMGNFIDMYVDAGVDVLMTLTPPPLGDADPEDIKKRFGNKVALMGGFDAINEIWLSTPNKIRETVRERLSIYKPGGGYIMDGSNSLVWETPVENVKAFVESGIEFGRY